MTDNITSNKTQVDLESFPTDVGPIYRRLTGIAIAVVVLGLLSYFDVLAPLFGGAAPDTETEEPMEAPVRDPNAKLPVSG